MVGIKVRTLVVLVCIAGLVGCGATGVATRPDRSANGGSSTTSRTSATKASGAPDGWVGSDATSVAFLLASNHDGLLSGSLQISQLKTQGDQTVVKGTTYEVHGTVDGERVSLTVDSSPPWSGRLHSSVLTLNIPQPDGSLGALEMHPATVAEFNDAVGVLRDSAASNNQAVADDKAEAARERAQEQAQMAHEQATQALDDAISSAGSTTSEAADVTYDDELADLQTDLATMQSDFDALAGIACEDVYEQADSVIADGDQVTADSDAVVAEDDQTDVAAEDATRAKDAITDALDALGSAASDLGLDPPDHRAADTATTSLQQAVDAMTSRRNAAKTKTDQFVSAASALSDRASTFEAQYGC